MLDIVRAFCEDLEGGLVFFHDCQYYEPMIQFSCICWRPFIEPCEIYIFPTSESMIATCQHCL